MEQWLTDVIICTLMMIDDYECHLPYFLDRSRPLVWQAAQPHWTSPPGWESWLQENSFNKRPRHLEQNRPKADDLVHLGKFLLRLISHCWVYRTLQQFRQRLHVHSEIQQTPSSEGENFTSQNFPRFRSLWLILSHRGNKVRIETACWWFNWSLFQIERWWCFKEPKLEIYKSQG